VSRGPRTARPFARGLFRASVLAAATLLVWPAVSSGAPSAIAAEKARARRGPDIVPVFSSDNLFEFHSGFWINLHLFLYEQAAIATAGPHGTPHEAELSTDASATAGLSEDESKAWSNALVYYRAKILRHDLASDDDMVKIKNRLEDNEGETSTDRTDLDPQLISVLDAAAPVYREHWWLLHDASNQTWIKAVMPLVDDHGASLAQQISTAFETPWPDHPLRVDVVAYANYAGSYTTPHPTRIMISSIDGGNQDTAGLEVLFHAASYAMLDAISTKVKPAYERAKREPPPELPEMMLWFTTGYLVEQIYPNYTAYADRFALWTEGSKTGYRAALIKDWQPRLDGKVPVEAALAQLAADFSVAAAPDKKPAAPPAEPEPKPQIP
jgi:hypothetical protein